MLENAQCYGEKVRDAVGVGELVAGWSGRPPEKVGFDQSCEGSEGLGVAAISGKSTPDRWIRKCKCPEVGMCQDASAA